MKLKKILSLILLVSILTGCSSIIFQTVTAKVTRTEFEGYLHWKGGGDAKDWVAGQTAHRRSRITILNITSDYNGLNGANLTRIVNYNRNNHRNTVQRWGKFEIKYEDTVLWRGSWTGSRGSDTPTVENFVGHGVRNDLVGLKIKFTITDLDPGKPGTNMTGMILNTNG